MIEAKISFMKKKDGEGVQEPHPGDGHVAVGAFIIYNPLRLQKHHKGFETQLCAKFKSGYQL